MSPSTTLEPCAATGSGPPTTLGAIVKRLYATYVTWRMERTAIATLRSMSDRALIDIGLTRGEIASAVKGKAVHPNSSGGSTPAKAGGRPNATSRTALGAHCRST